MTILVKYPTRQRPSLFLSTLVKYMDTAVYQHRYLITIDRNDRTMLPLIDTLNKYPGVEVDIAEPRGKVAAINSGIPATGWDVLVLASDDHIPVQQGWDTQVVKDFKELAPNGEPRMLWYKDIRNPGICFMPVMNRAAYDLTGYIYHPDYVSLWCDNEQTEVMTANGVMLQVDRELWRNESPDWGGSQKRDSLYRMNNSLFRKDQSTFNRRKAAGFP